MIKSFACRDTEKLFNDQRVRRFKSFERQARKRLMVLHAAPSLESLMLNPGNRFHSLKGDRKGQYAIRLINNGASVSSGMMVMHIMLK
jgi:proteic killer suppression protein